MTADDGAAANAVRPADLSAVRAVVVDASVMGKGGDLRLSTLGQIASLAVRDGHLDVWVPEPVLWEWCEHATREHSAAADSLRVSRGRLQRAGVEVPEMVLSTQEVRAQVEAAVRAMPRTKVVKLMAEDAHAALQDQILGVPPGERLTTSAGRSVKTGASDSAWIRTVHRAANRDADKYVILSADGDVATAYKQWGWAAPLTLKSYKALAVAFEGAAFPPLMAEHVRRVVDRVVHEDWLVAAFDPVDEGGVVGVALGENESYVLEDLMLHEVVATVAIGNLKIIDRVGTVQGILYLIGQVEVTGWTHSNITDRLEATSSERVACLMRTLVVLGPDAEWLEGLDLAFEDSTYLHPLTAEWGDARDAFEELLEALRSLPGCEGLEWPPAADEHANVVDHGGRHTTDGSCGTERHLWRMACDGEPR